MPMNLFPDHSNTLVQKAPKDKTAHGLGKPQSKKSGRLARKVHGSKAVATGGANTPFKGALAANRGDHK